MVCLSDERMVEERVRELWSTSSETGEAHRRTYCTVHISKTRISFQNYYGYFFSYFYKFISYRWAGTYHLKLKWMRQLNSLLSVISSPTFGLNILCNIQQCTNLRRPERSIKRWLPEISSSSSSDWKLLLFSQVGGEYFFLVTYCRPMVLLALFTRFLESVLTKGGRETEKLNIFKWHHCADSTAYAIQSHLASTSCWAF